MEQHSEKMFDCKDIENYFGLQKMLVFTFLLFFFLGGGVVFVLVFLFVCSFCFSLNSFLNLCSGVIL